MKWFKHYSNALDSESLADLIRDCGLQGYARYWILLEYLASQFDGETHSFRVPIDSVRRLLRIRSWNELETFAERIGSIRGMELKRNGNVFEIEAAILLELQSKDFKKMRHDSGTSARKTKSKDKDKEEDKDLDKEFIICSDGDEKNSKNLPAIHLSNTQIHGAIAEFNSNEVCNNLLLKTEASVQKAWIDAYPSVSWITHEMTKANVWIKANPKKAPKNFGRFFSNWLAKGFENYRKGLPSNSNKKTFGQMKQERNEEILREIQAESENEN